MNSWMQEKSALAGLLLVATLGSATQAQSLQAPTYSLAQAQRGQAAYMQNCSGCHGDQLDNGEGDGAPALVGPSFTQQWNTKSLDELFSFINDNMPASNPGSIPPATNADILAFLLSKNGIPAGANELPPDVTKLKGMSGPK